MRGFAWLIRWLSLLAAAPWLGWAGAALANNTVGAWSPVFNWPLVAIHTVLTPDGRVMSYGTTQSGQQTAYFIYDIWDAGAGPTDSGHVTLPNTTGTDIFCSSQLVLPTGGGVFLAGGDRFVDGRTTNTGNNNSNLFNYTANTLAPGNPMNRERWYSSSTALLNGEIYIQGGNGGADRPEIRGTNGVFRLLAEANTSSLSPAFPRNFLAPDGRVFGIDSSGKMYYVVVSSSGSVSAQATLPLANAGWTSSAVMFRPGRILQIGGNSNGAVIVDINGLAAPVTTAAASMAMQRQWVNATVLADGRVVATSGSQVDNELVGVNNSAEIWNPATDAWTIGPSAIKARLYHSNALLLPDASVLVAGGGAPGPVNNLNAEIYYPPYLYSPQGGFAARPTIVTHPSTLNIGTRFTLTTGGAGTINRVTLVRTGSATHSFNMDQRFIELFFTATDNQLDVMAPARAGDAPPGYYMLFVINDSGVPSMARIVKMNVAANPNPLADHTPTIGGLGSTRYQLACRSNETLVGVHGRAGAGIEQIGPQCIRLHSDGRWIGNPVNRMPAGGPGGSAFAKTCARDAAVTGFRGRGSQTLNQLDLECKALASNGKVVGSGTFLGPQGGAGGTPQGPFGCGTLNPAFALYGTAGASIDGFGIQCRQGVLNAAPTVVNPGNQNSQVETAVDLAISASDINGDALSYGASGLPAGLAMNTVSGHVTGIPTTPGVYSVTVTASDGASSGSAIFQWAIFPQEPFTLEPLSPRPPQLSGTSLEFTGSAHNGINTRYKWSFGDGTPETPYSSSPSIEHTFTSGGVHFVTMTAVDERGVELVQVVTQAVHMPATENPSAVSSNILYAANANHLWVVNQDNDSVTVFDATTNTRMKEIPVGIAPRSLARAPSGEIWVTGKQQATISVIDPSTLTVVRTINLPFASQPFGIAFSPTGAHAYVALEGAGKLLKLDSSSGEQVASVDVGANPRHLSITHDGATVYVSRYVTPRLPGEDTALVLPAMHGGEVVAVDADSMTLRTVVTLQHSDKPDLENQGSGVPNYLGAVTISPDGTQAWVPSKQDNVMRGAQRNGQNLNFQNTVRAISSRIDLNSGIEDYVARIDHDDAGVASAAAFDRYGVYLFVALETSREVAVIDAFGHFEKFRFTVGRAPQGIAVSPDGLRLYVNNFMDRTVGVYDLAPLINGGVLYVPALATLSSITNEKLQPQVLAGKQFFYDARDPRMARDRYISCASCHNDGGHDGRVWDLTGFGEGLRNTVNIRGRAGAQGFLHWSSNFDEVQDFEGQIRNLSGGLGLMMDDDFFGGTRSDPLGDAKAGISADLDALAAYIASLNKFANSPFRNQDGSFTADAVAGKAAFRTANCGQCHSGSNFTDSGVVTAHDIGTLKVSSGQRLYGPLSGIDTPTLRDVWATAPYLHDGSAATLEEAVQAHNNMSLSGPDLEKLGAYLRQIDGQELPAGC